MGPGFESLRAHKPGRKVGFFCYLCAMKSSIRTLLPLLAAAALLAACHAPKPPKTIVQPAFLQPGDRIALIEPSFAQADSAARLSDSVLCSWGYETVRGPHVGAKHAGAYAGTAAERAADLKWALEDPDIDAILCLGGGYGAIHLLEYLSQEDFRAHPKWLIGFSDISVLHAMNVSAGVMSLHGTVGGFLAKFHGSDPSSLALRDFLAGNVPEYELPAHELNIPGEATGTLIGGNLCTYATLADTWADYFDGTEGDLILFIEEVEETWHSIDRLFNMLRLTGRLERVKGIVLGQFTKCPADLEYASPEAMLIEEYLREMNIPVCCGFPAGHEFENNYPLPLGAPARLSVSPDGATLSFDL